MNSSPDALNQLVQAAAPIAILFLLLGITAFSFSIAYIIRLWLVQTATFDIQKDVADIRDHLLGLDEPAKDSKPSVVADLKDYVPEEEKRARAAQRIAKLKPRRAFMWIALSIPILLVILIVLSVTSN